jgi:HlyD family secretion protein
MAIDTKHRELESLRIDHSERGGANGGEPPLWAQRYILGGIAVIVLLGVIAIVYRVYASDVPEVEVVRTSAQTTNDIADETVLTATGYIVAHHTINVNSKVTGRLEWIGVEKGDKVKEGQVLVRLENQEFRAAYEQAKGAVENAQAYLEELQHGSRPQEIQQAQHNLDEARATAVNDKVTLDRTKELAAAGVDSKQQLDDATAKYESDQQRMNSLQQAFVLAKIGPRPEEILRAQGALAQAQGQLDYAKSQLDATIIRAPVTGTILDRTAEKGELITAQFASGSAGGPQGSVVSLADLNDLQVELDIAQADFARLSPAQKAIVTTDTYPDKTYDGVIAQISPEANRQKATVQVKVQVLNPGKYPDVQLRPEMNATVKFLANAQPKNAKTPQGVFVPSTALHDLDGNKIVFIAYDGKAVARPVQILSQRSDGAMVDTLVGGENVITTAPATLKDGDRIKIKGQG